MSDAADETIRVRVETRSPGQGDELYVHVSPPDEMAGFLAEVERAGLDGSDNVLEHALPEILEAAAIICGALGPMANVIKAYAHRNDGKHVEYEVNGEHFVFDGMSPDQIEEILKQLKNARDAQWRDQYPGRWPEIPDQNPGRSTTGDDPVTD